VEGRAVLLLLTGCVLASPAFAAGKGWTALFNGRDLSNFDIAYSSKPVDSRPASAMFEVKDGVVHTYPGQAAGTHQPSAYFQTRGTYTDYVLHIEYRWGDRKFAPRMNRLKDAGLVFHIYEDAPQSWPHGIECQIEDKDVADLWLISSRADVTVKDAAQRPNPDPLQDGQPAYAPDGQKRTFGDHGKYVRVRHAANLEHPGWNSVDVVVRGDSAVYLVNGHPDMRVTGMKKWTGDGWAPLTEGKILFQAEFAEIWYRNIKIRPVRESDPR
jgi:hypothetical protein